MKIYNDVLQGTKEWHDLRRGMLTASTMSRVLTEKKLEPVKIGSSFEYEILTARLTDFEEVVFETFDMQRGKDDEITARVLYSQQYAEVREVGFITDEICGHTVGYSPDGLVGESGLIEIKSRRPKYQIETIISGQVPLEYMLQIQTGLIVSGREWLDFISFSAGLPMFVKRVYPDPIYQCKIKDSVEMFEAEISRKTMFYKNNSKVFMPTEPKTYDFEGVIL